MEEAQAAVDSLYARWADLEERASPGSDAGVQR
jgi:hypothetical protein